MPSSKEDGALCETDLENHVMTISDMLKEGYTYEAGNYITFSIEGISMPSSSRPTGDVKIEFFDHVEHNGEEYYRLVDSVTIPDMLRALPGSLEFVNV